MAEKKINKETAEALNLGDPEDLSAFGKQLHEQTREFYYPIYERHERAWNFYRGDQWSYYRRVGLAMTTFNIVGPHIDIIAANLTDSSVVFQTSAKNKEDNAMTKIHNEVLRLACEQDSLHVRLYGHIIDSLVKGYSICKVTHDGSRLVPTRIEFVDPYDYMGEPGVRRPDNDGTYHWHSEWVTAMTARELYPDKWKDIKWGPRASSGQYDFELWVEREGNFNYTHEARIHELYIKTNETEKIPGDVTEKELLDERAEIERIKAPRVVLEQDHQAHYEDHETHAQEVIVKLTQMASQAVQDGKVSQEEAQQGLQGAIQTHPLLNLLSAHNASHEEMLEEDPEDGRDTNPKGLREKYNGWRRIVFGGSDFLVLEDGSTEETDEEGRGVHPYTLMTSPETGADVYQWSITERCMEMQEMINLWLSKFQDHLSLCSCPMLALDVTRVEVDPNQITALAGSIIPCDGDPREIMYWVQPPQISGQLIQNTYQMMKQIELITGVSDVELGAYPDMERASEPMIRQLKEAGRARWREYQRELQDFLQRVGHKLLMVIQSNMTEETQLRVGKTEDSFKVLNQKQEGRSTRLNDMTVGAFDVRIELQPLQTLTADAKLQRALRLFTMSNAQGFAPYDLLAVSEATEDPILDDSVKRQVKMQQQMMQQQAQESQAKQKQGAR